MRPPSNCRGRSSRDPHRPGAGCRGIFGAPRETFRFRRLMFSQAPKEWFKPMLVRKRGYVRAHLDNGKRDPRYCMDYSLAADMVAGDAEYNILIDTLAEASARFEELQEAVFELRHLCESCKSGDMHTKQILEVLKRHGA